MQTETRYHPVKKVVTSDVIPRGADNRRTNQWDNLRGAIETLLLTALKQGGCPVYTLWISQGHLFDELTLL